MTEHMRHWSTEMWHVNLQPTPTTQFSCSRSMNLWLRLRGVQTPGMTEALVLNWRESVLTEKIRAGENYSECQVGDDSYPYTFEAPGSTATHPCPNLSDLAYNALCEVMQQYNIPWCQVYTHDDVPDATHKDVVGKGWVNNYFIPRLRDNCNVPANSQCRNT